MKILSVKNIYDVDTLSPVNNKGWGKILEAVKGEEESVILDFKGMIVNDPWNNRFFLDIMRSNGKGIRLYDAEELCKGIRGFCLLNNVQVNVENIESASLKKKGDVVDMKLQMNYDRKIKSLKEVSSIVSGVGVIEVYKVFENIGNVETVESIKRVIPIMFEGIKVVKIDLGTATIQENMFFLLMDIVKEYKKNGVVIHINSADPKTRSNMQIYRDMNLNLSKEEKFKIVQEFFKKDMPIMVATFKRSKSIDKVGREGEGREVANNPAVLKELLVKEDREGNVTYKVLVDIYKAVGFVTKLSYGWENDKAEHPGIVKLVQELDIEDVGFFNEFVGRKRHIYEPIHSENGLGIDMFVEEDGKVVKKKLSIPESMKVVFDDFGVSYDKEFLDQCIEVTKLKLRGEL